MHIAIFIKNTIYHGQFGGLETQNHNLVEGLKRAGHTVTVFAPTLDQELPDHIFITGTTPGKYNQAWWSRSLLEFKRQHAHNPFDVVISQSAAGASIIASRIPLNIKTVVIAHGTIWGELKTIWFRTKSAQEIPSLLKNLIFSLKTYFLLDRKYLRDCNHIIAVSKVVSSSLQKEFGLPPEKITVINNGVDLKRFSVYRSLAGSETIKFLYFGRLEKEKGLEVLEVAFSRLQAELPNISLLVVGSGSYRIKLSEGVEIRSAVPYDDIPELLSTMDVFVLPTIRIEGLPMTLIESTAAGLPIIAANIGGNDEVVKDSLNGLLVKSGDVEELLIAMRKLAVNAALRQEMSLAAKKIALEQFSLGGMVVKYLEVLRNL